LIDLKEELLAGNAEWNTVAPEADGLEELKQTKKEKKKELRALKRKAVADGAVLQSSPKRSHVTPSVASTVPSPVPSPVKILVNNNQENLDPQNPPPRLRVRPAPNNDNDDDDDEQEPKKAKYVGLSSTVEDRTEKAAVGATSSELGMTKSVLLVYLLQRWASREIKRACKPCKLLSRRLPDSQILSIVLEDSKANPVAVLSWLM
jgi:hypothetical protein